MEGKEQTSSECQLIRYAYMESTRTNSFSYEPLKILSKWDEFSRSRLCIWMRNKVMNCFLNSMEWIFPQKEEMVDFSKSLDDGFGMKSWVCGHEVPSFEVALNLSYFGVLHNKEDSKEIHGFLKIFQKVIKEELLLRETNMEQVKHGSESYQLLKTNRELNS
jgi:hypothetical protein